MKHSSASCELKSESFRTVNKVRIRVDFIDWLGVPIWAQTNSRVRFGRRSADVAVFVSLRLPNKSKIPSKIFPFFSFSHRLCVWLEYYVIIMRIDIAHYYVNLSCAARMFTVVRRYPHIQNSRNDEMTTMPVTIWSAFSRFINDAGSDSRSIFSLTFSVFLEQPQERIDLKPFLITLQPQLLRVQFVQLFVLYDGNWGLNLECWMHECQHLFYTI